MKKIIHVYLFMLFLSAYLIAADNLGGTAEEMGQEALKLAESILSKKALNQIQWKIEDYYSQYSQEEFLSCLQEDSRMFRASPEYIALAEFFLAFSYEKLGNIPLAINHYVKLSKFIRKPQRLAALFSKINVLIDQTQKPNWNDPYVVLLYLEHLNVKEWNLGALAAENSVTKIKKLHSAINASFKDLLKLGFESLYATANPSLFICFDETKIMVNWIRANLLPDLELMGVGAVVELGGSSTCNQSLCNRILKCSAVFVCLTPEMFNDEPSYNCRWQLHMLPCRESTRETEQKTFVITFGDTDEISNIISHNFAQLVMNKKLDFEGDNFKAKFDLYSRLLQKTMDRSVDPWHWEKFLQQITMHCQTIFPQ